MRRRGLFIAAGVGVAAAAAGIGSALWRDRSSAAVPDLWTLRFQRPGGGELAFAELRGKPLLLNFWATWCPPCVIEMPLLDRFDRRHRKSGWQVVGIAVDQENPVRQFIAQRGIGFPIVLAGVTGLELSRALGNDAGGLPFSIAFGADGQTRAHKLGVLDEQTLTRWAATLS